MFDVKITQGDQFKAWASLMWLVLSNIILVTVDIFTDIYTGINLIMDERIPPGYGIALLVIPFALGFIMAPGMIIYMLMGKLDIKTGFGIILFPLFQLFGSVMATLDIMQSRDEEENLKHVKQIKYIEAITEAVPALFVQLLVILHYVNNELDFNVPTLIISLVSSYASITMSLYNAYVDCKSYNSKVQFFFFCCVGHLCFSILVLHIFKVLTIGNILLACLVVTIVFIIGSCYISSKHENKDNIELVQVQYENN